MSAHPTTTTSLTPRHRRLLLALLAGPVTREQADRIAGASNSPDEVLRLRRRFALKVPCVRKGALDKDGRHVEVGIYSLADTDKATAILLVGGQA